MADAKRIIAVIDDLMFQSRLVEQARSLGYETRVADTPAALQSALADGGGLVVVDLHVRGLDWRDAVVAAKAAGLPVLAFGRHTEAALLREARDAGCDRVVPRSTFVEELPVLLAELARPRATQGGATSS
jgi:CheY-like chemotaxis protein